MSTSEIFIENKILKNHIIVSLTTSKEKIEKGFVDRLIESLLNQTLIPYKILLSINKKDIIYINNYLKRMINILCSLW